MESLSVVVHRVAGRENERNGNLKTRCILCCHEAMPPWPEEGERREM